MSMLNQAHVEAICSATYLENYLDCLDALPDDLQRILSQLREIDVKLTELEHETAPFEEIFALEHEDKGAQSKSIAQLQRALIKMQECEDEKMQLSAMLMDFIEDRVRQLDQDRENLDPANHVVNDSAPRINGNSKRESAASKENNDGGRDTPKQVETKPATSAPKKRKQRQNDTHISAPKMLNNKYVAAPTSPAATQAQEITAKKDETHSAKSSTKLSAKRKRRSRKEEKCTKEIEIEMQEPTYCLCKQISYGDMIGCDNDACIIEWFHFNCVSLTNKPKGKWYCPKCRGDRPTMMRKMDKK